MKKLLALVLALVMSLSLVTISNADFADADLIDLDEAVEVLSAVGVLEGDGKNFNPKAELTREQAAKIIAYLDLGKDVAEALPAVKAFNDVEADRWSAKYIAYCADQGYLAGVGEGNFDPAGKLTGYAFGKMILCVLGYDATIEQFTGASWQIKVAALMQKNDIAKGVDGSASAVLTREQAAQYALNALLVKYVEYENKGTDINLGSIGSITVGASAAKANAEGKTLYQKLFDKLTKTVAGVSDEFGRPAHKWTFKGKEVGTYADSADYVLTATKDYKDAVALYKDVVDDDYKNTIAYEVYVNGEPCTPASSGAAAISEAIKSGDIVEIFMDKNDKFATVVVIRFSLAKVDDINTKVSKADKEDDVTAYVKLATIDGTALTGLTKVKDTDFAGFDYEEDDVILYVKGGTQEVIASQLAESVEGKVTAKKGSNVTIDGTSYKNVGAMIALDYKGTFYLNVAGQIMASKGSVEKSGNYAYIYSVDIDTTGKNADGYVDSVVTVYYVDQNGVKASAEVDAYIGTASATTTAGTTGGDTVAYYDKAKTDLVKTGVVAFKINSDGEFEKVAGENDIESATLAKAVDKDNALIDTGIYANGKTSFVFLNSENSKMKVTTADGYKNVKIAADMTVTAIVDDDDIAQYVFVGAKNGNVASTGFIAVLLDTEASVTKDDDHTYYAYAVVVDGEETTLTLKDGELANTIKKGAVISYNLEDGYAVDVNDKAETGIEFKSGTVGAAYDEYVVIGGEQFDADKGTIYTVTLDYKAETDTTPDTVTVTEASGLAKDDKVTYTVDKNGDLEFVFVTEELK